jgi:hypothetical protein
MLLGVPDWVRLVGAHTRSGRPMSDQKVTDVVAGLVSSRVANPGQPYSATNSLPPLGGRSEQNRNKPLGVATDSWSRIPLLQLQQPDLQVVTVAAQSWSG